MKGRNLFTFVKTAPEIVFIAITWLCQGMFINAHKCFQSRSNSMNLHHVKIIQEQSNIHYSLFSIFYYSKGLNHLYYMKQTLVVSQSVRAFASHVEYWIYKSRPRQTYVVKQGVIINRMSLVSGDCHIKNGSRVTQ